MLKTLFFGTSAFAVPSLQTVARLTNLAGVVTQPDRPSGRGHKLLPTPVKEAALALRIPTFEPASLKTFAGETGAEPFDLFALASYGKIVPQSILDLPRLGALNVHPSLLPAFPGLNTHRRALEAGVFCYLTKPFNENDLLRCIRSAVDGRTINF